MFRSTDGGRTFEKVLYKDEYTSANEVLIDPKNPNILYATLVVAATELHRRPGVRQRRHGHLQVHRRRHDLDAARRRTAGHSPGEHRDRRERFEHPLRHDRAGSGTDRLLQVHRRRRALVPGDSQPRRARGSGAGHAAARAHRRRRSAHGHHRSEGSERRLHRVDGDVAHDGRRPDVERRPRRAGRRRLSAHLDQSERSANHLRRRRSGRGGLRESRPELEQLVQPEHRRRCITSRPTTRFRTASARASRIPAARASRADPTTAASRSTTGIPSTSRNTAWPRPTRTIPTSSTAASATGVSRYDRRTAQTTQVGPDTSGTLPGGGAMNRNVRTMPLHFSPIDGTTMFYASNVVWKSIDHGHSWTRISPRPDAPDVGGARQHRQVREHREARADGQHHRARARARGRSRSSGPVRTTATSR